MHRQAPIFRCVQTLTIMAVALAILACGASVAQAYYSKEVIKLNDDGSYDHNIAGWNDNDELVWYVSIHYNKDGVVYAWEEHYYHDNPNPEDSESAGGFRKEDLVLSIMKAIESGEYESNYEIVLLIDTPFGQVLLANGDVIDVYWNPGDEDGATVKKPKEDLGLDDPEVLENNLPSQGFARHFDYDGGPIGEQILDYARNPHKDGNGDAERFMGEGGPSMKDLLKYGMNYMDLLGDPEIVYPPPEPVKE